MSSPFPEEEQAQLESLQPTSDPWSGPPQPHWYSGLGFTEENAYLGPVIQAMGSGAAKAASVLDAGIASLSGGLADTVDAKKGSYLRELADQDQANLEDARARVKALTPDPATTGTAAQILHSAAEGAYLLTAGGLTGGAGAVATVGAAEGGSRYQELRESGVKPSAAAESAAVTGVSAAAGALIPGGSGTSLLSKVLTGAGSNAALGVAGRYADHAILQHAGYPEMAEQQKVWDGTQLLTDLVLGGTFGALAHVHAPKEAQAIKAAAADTSVRDAALAANLAMQDRASAPGVAVNPGASGAHQAALEKALEDVLRNKSVDVSGTGIEDGATFARRPDIEHPETADLIHEAISSSGLLEETAKLDQLEQALGRRISGEKIQPVEQVAAPTEPESPQRTTFETAKGSTYEVTDKGTTIRNKAARPDVGHEGDFGPQPESETTFYVSPEDAVLLGEIQTEGPKRAISVNPEQGTAGIRYLEGKDAGKIERRTNVTVKTKPAVGLTPVELWQGGRVAHFGNEITRVDESGSASRSAEVAGGKQSESSLSAASAKQNPNELPGAETALRHADAALTDRPDLEIRADSGDAIMARDALASAEKSLSDTTKQAPGLFQALSDCFSRHGT